MQLDRLQEEVIFENGFRLQFFLDADQKLCFQGFGTRGGVELHSGFTQKDLENFINKLREAYQSIVSGDNIATHRFAVIAPLIHANSGIGRIVLSVREDYQTASLVTEIIFSGKKGGYKQSIDVYNPYLLQELADKLETLMK